MNCSFMPSLDCSFMPSLEHRALIKIAISLWDQEDIRDSIAMFDFAFFYAVERQNEWLVLEEKVTVKVQELPLPDLLRKKVLGFIKPIGFEISKWREFHQRFLSLRRNTTFVTEILNKLCWTPQGTLDRKKTAKALIRDEDLSISKRYKLACIYCLKDDILTLWIKMPEKYRKRFYSEGDLMEINQHPLVVLWTYIANGEMTRMENFIERRWRKCAPYQYGFEYAAAHGNKVASEYFLQKLTPEEREESLAFYTKHFIVNDTNDLMPFVEDNASGLFFLHSQMNEEQQLEVFKKYHYYVLNCLLDWPRQDFFIEIAKHLWTLLSEDDYFYLLKAIVNKVIDGYRDYSYQKLFREFWQQSPIIHKECVIHACASSSLLSDLFQIKDKENVNLILEDATITDREKFIFSHRGKSVCKSLIYNEEMDLLEFLVKKCIPSKVTMIKFRQEFKEYIVCESSVETIEKVEGMCSKFFQLLNDLIKAYD